MTIIAAMWESDVSILIAADSGQTETSAEIRTIFNSKLQRHPDAPLAWACAGNPAIGVVRFSNWLRQYQWPPKDWQSFQDEVAAYLSDLNGKQREICKLAQVEAQPDDLASVLIVGFLNDARVFDIDDRGVIDDIGADRGFHAIGSGGAHARVIHIAFNSMHLEASADKKLDVILQIAAGTAPGCSLPIHIWRVKRDSIEHVRL